MKEYATVNGDATATKLAIAPTATITHTATVNTAPTSFMDVNVPAGLPNLGSIVLSSTGQVATINGPGSFQVTDLLLSGGTLTIDNANGPVTLYVTGTLSITGQGRVVVTDPNPEKF